ncbi:hypothetical protein LWI29_012450 [Acer saccharum]|uniref:Uncharacterized protein n=1 Tax=Acer saccharum TaxID=4024 RepID=A0AA39VIR0_ACESA|nr:hypothetical protein LWI29_012450 [Acer saccharum]
MEISIISREIIKPSSATPNHLRTHKLSRLDQSNIDTFISIIFFFDKAPKNSDRLKTSLSQTLSHYYPLAGQVKDHLSVDCNDNGVTFVEAQVVAPVDMSDVLKRHEFDPEGKLVPRKEHEMLEDQSIFAVQVSYFGCGGVSICFLIRHVIADATTAANFIKSWSALSCNGDGAVINDVTILDGTSIFPPRDDSGMSASSGGAHKMLFSSTETLKKRFTFEGSKISALKEKIGNRPSRFETVFAVIWGAVAAAKREGDDLVATIPVNLRRRMNPPLPDQCFGNLHTIIQANWPTEETTSYSSVTEKIHELISMVNGEYVKKAHPNGWLLYLVTNNGNGRLDTIRRRLFMISSMCNVAFYKTDFGWGEPVLIAPVGKLNAGDHIVVELLDTIDGKGIDAWVTMSKEDMDKFEQDSAVIAYASSSSFV